MRGGLVVGFSEYTAAGKNSQSWLLAAFNHKFCLMLILANLADDLTPNGPKSSLRFGRASDGRSERMASPDP